VGLAWLATIQAVILFPSEYKTKTAEKDNMLMDITIAQLTKVYRGGVYALDDLSMTIPTGMFGLLGPNGAGKTTLMRILAGILHPSAGEIHVGEFNGGTLSGFYAADIFLGRWGSLGGCSMRDNRTEMSCPLPALILYA
jgi:ABC-type bacteriocin/lantibiotic exporter with double-glycine peptidase domain